MENGYDEPIIEQMHGFAIEKANGDTDVMFFTDGTVIYLSELIDNGAINNVFLRRLVNNIVTAIMPVLAPVLSVTLAVTQLTTHITNHPPSIALQATNYAINRGHNTFPTLQKQGGGVNLSFENGMIRTQNYFTSWRFGLSTIASAGCGPIAVFNVLNHFGRLNNGSLLLDESIATTQFANIIRDFEMFFGTNAFGFFGANPIHISPYLTARGLRTNTFLQQSSMNTAMANADNDDAMIVLFFEKEDGRPIQIHYTTIIKVADGIFRRYNTVGPNISSLDDFIANRSSSTTNVGFVQGWVITWR
jgi:hypothetical protein